MKPTIKIVVPMAGLGKRLRPHTWSRPKQLVSMAGKTVIDHLIDSLGSLPEPGNFELIAIVGYLGDQIEQHIRQHYPDLTAHFVVQDDPRGQSHAVKLAEKHLHGPMMLAFADTLIKADLSVIRDANAEAFAWVQPVPDPRRFGVAEVGADGWVKRLIEKPTDMSNNLVVVGFYYFREAEDLVAAIDEQMRRDLQLKGEYYLADAINLMLEKGLKMRTQNVAVWLDAGTPDAVLETNRYLLAHGKANGGKGAALTNATILPPVYLHPTAQVSASVLGPNVSVGAGCRIDGSIIRDSILEDGASVAGVILEGSLVGQRANLSGSASMVNIGDDSEIKL